MFPAQALNGKINDFTLKDILQLAKKHSIKESVAKEYLEQIVEIFSQLGPKAKELDVKDETINRITKELRLKLV